MVFVETQPIEVTPNGLECALSEKTYGYQNLKPRYRSNSDHCRGCNHDRYGDVLNSDRGKHYGMLGKSTLNRRIDL